MLPRGMSQSILKYFTARPHSSLPRPLSTRISPAAISSAKFNDEVRLVLTKRASSENCV